MAHTSEMAAGGAERCVCLSVLIGTGLEYAKLGLSGYEKTSRQICHLTPSQVTDLMAHSIANFNRLTVLQANNLLDHRVMRLQLNLLMGLPGFMHMALKVLHTNLKTGLPRTDEEFRSAADTQCCSKQSLLPFWTTDTAFLDYNTNMLEKSTYGQTIILQATSRSSIIRCEG